MNRAARNDLIFGSTVLGLALLMLFVGIPIGIESPGDVDILALAPTFWPNIIMALLALIGIIMVISSICLLYTSPSPRDLSTSRMPSSA